MVKYLPTYKKKQNLSTVFNNKILDPHPTQPVISIQGARNAEIS